MYEDLVEIRDINVAGETKWHWIKSDQGCFGDATDGPMRDWIDGHQFKYFEKVRNFDTVVTGGTSCGMHARFYAKKFKHVYAFEPDPLSFHCMVNNTQFDNVYKLNAAIGHGNGLVGIQRHDPTNVGMNSLTNAGEFKIPMMSIDSLNLQSCDLIQLDVEGFEQYAIAGAKNTINNFKPVIVAERFGTQDAQDFMSELGYILHDVSFMDFIYIPKDDNEFIYKVL